MFPSTFKQLAPTDNVDHFVTNGFTINGKLMNPLVNGSNGARVDESGIDLPAQ